MRQLIYFSTAADEQDQATLNNILAVARARNERDRITGILIAGARRYLQVIEGEAAALGSTMDRIRRDPRHVSINVLVERDIATRNFGHWSMALMRVPDLARYATFQQLIDALHDAVDPSLRVQILDLSRVFAKSPIRSCAASNEMWTAH